MQDLIKACKNGDLQAFSGLIDHYSSTVERFAFQIGVPYHDVPDVSQEVFIRVYRFLYQFDGKSSFTTWLYKITWNAAKDYHRKQSSWLNKFTRLKNDQTKCNASTDHVEESIIRDEEDELLLQCIHQLDEKYRVPIVLHFFHDVPYDQISTITGVKLSTIKVRVMRGKKKLAEKLDEEDGKGGIAHG
ncbi:RNA polymerase sigma factor [Virgibacillus byunsanensis]|uniref:RNA polymerase sigma factor n=1 Tax=Virgibacillus byunsanensis TaxID=570945 RepID=A0ABW3LL01_9BACI